jgi:type I restriction enzyme S subunit
MDTKALRQKILDLAIRGKLVPQDPNDEPASVLLERIRAEKQQMVKDGKLKAKDIKNDTVIFVGEDNLHYEKFPDGSVKCIEEEIPFALPQGWEWCRLGVIFMHNTGKALNTSNTAGRKMTYITTSNLYWDRFELDSLKEMYFSESEIEKCSVRKGDLLVCEGGDIGRAAVWKNEDTIRIQNHIHKLRPYVDIAIYYFYYLFYYYKNQNLIDGKGIGIQGLSSSMLHAVLVPLPSYKEQFRIVEQVKRYFELLEYIDNEKLDLFNAIQLAKFKILDLAIRGKLVPQDPNDEPASVLLECIRAEKEDLIKQGKIKRDKKESVIFRGEDNSYYEKIGQETRCIDDELPFEIPSNWSFVRLKEYWTLISGRDLSPSEYNSNRDGVPYITGASNFSIGNVEIVRWTPVPQVITKYGDLLFTCKGTVGEMAMNSFGTAHIARQVMAIRNTCSFNMKYLQLCLNYYIDNIRTSAKGLIPGISREDILNLIIPFPPLAEQQGIVNITTSVYSILNDIEKSLS